MQNAEIVENLKKSYELLQKNDYTSAVLICEKIDDEIYKRMLDIKGVDYKKYLEVGPIFRENFIEDENITEIYDKITDILEKYDYEHQDDYTEIDANCIIRYSFELIKKYNNFDPENKIVNK